MLFGIYSVEAYCEESSNSNANVHSCLPASPCAVIICLSHNSHKVLQVSQSNDSILSVVLQACLVSPDIPQNAKWKKAPFYRHVQATLALTKTNWWCTLLTVRTQSNALGGHSTHCIPSLQKDALICNHDPIPLPTNNNCLTYPNSLGPQCVQITEMFG